MTDSTKVVSRGDAIDDEMAAAEEQWARRYYGSKSDGEALGVHKAQTLVTITDQPGGRLLVYVQVQGKAPKRELSSYNRYQRIPDTGYVRVFNRYM